MTDWIGPKSDILTTIQSFLRPNLGYLYLFLRPLTTLKTVTGPFWPISLEIDKNIL